MSHVPKFPRIPHLPWSPGGTADDRRLSSVPSLLGRPLVITEKLDGANVCLTREAVFARTHSGPPAHPAFDWLKARYAALRSQIPDDLSVFCEYTFAVHTIEYEALPSYLFVIAVRRERDCFWLSWEETVAMAEQLGVPTVPLLQEGIFDTEAELRQATEALVRSRGLYGGREGIVVRLKEGFADEKFAVSVAKWVKRSGAPTEDWRHRPIRKQRLIA